MKTRGSEPTIELEFQAKWVLGLLVLIMMLHLIAPSRAWIALLATLGGSMGVGYFWARQLATGVAIAREQFYGWAHVGDLLEEKFELRNDSFLPVLWIEIDDRSDLPGYSACTVRSVDRHQAIAWRTEGTCSQRGLFTLGPWQARTSDPFGFFAITFAYASTQSILIYPPVVHLPALQLPRGAITGVGRTSRGALDLATDAGSVRAYTAGDSVNRIHWRSTARLEKLMVKTFESAPSGDLWMLLDLDIRVQAGVGAESTEEYAVILASSLAHRMLLENRAVGLIGYGATSPRGPGSSQPLPILVLPDSGSAHQWRILQALALVRAGGNWPLDRVLNEMGHYFGCGTTLAVITPSCSPDWLAGLVPALRRGVAVSAILLDAESFGGSEGAQPLAGILADLGVQSHRITRGMPFQPIIHHDRIGRPEYQVLPGTGRVIVVE